MPARPCLTMDIDEDVLMAAFDMGHRSGATELEIGYTNDDGTGWFVSANFRGARIFVEGYDRPEAACDAFLRRMLDGAMCRRCGKQIRMRDGKDGCRWTRVGKKYEPGCGQPVDMSIPTLGAQR